MDPPEQEHWSKRPARLFDSPEAFRSFEAHNNWQTHDQHVSYGFQPDEPHASCYRDNHRRSENVYCSYPNDCGASGAPGGYSYGTDNRVDANQAKGPDIIQQLYAGIGFVAPPTPFFQQNQNEMHSASRNQTVNSQTWPQHTTEPTQWALGNRVQPVNDPVVANASRGPYFQHSDWTVDPSARSKPATASAPSQSIPLDFTG